MPLDEKPTVDYITALREHLIEVWEPTWGDWEERDEYYFQTFKLWPKGMVRPEYHPGRSRQIVDAAVDHQLAYTPLVHRFPAGEAEVHKQRADRVESYLDAVFDEAALMEPSLTWKTVGKNLIHLGYAVVNGPILDMVSKPRKPQRSRGEGQDEYESRLTLWENQKKTWMPFRIRAPHPARVLLDPEEKQPKVGIMHALRYSHQLHDLTRRRKGRNQRGVEVWDVGQNPFALIMTDEYWTMDWHAMAAHTGPDSYGGSNGGHKQQEPGLLFVERNPWGYVPFNHAFCGWGQVPTREDRNDPRYLAAGILTGVMESLLLQAQAISGRQQALMIAVWSLLGTTMDPEELAAMMGRSDILPLPDPSAVWWLKAPDMPQWVFQAEDWFDKDIELGTMSRSLAGIRPVGVSTGVQQNLLDTSASSKFVAANKQLEHMATVVGSNILRLVDVLDETLYCRGHTIRPSDIEHDYSLEVSFEVANPMVQAQQQEIGMKEVQAGLLSRETYLRARAKLEDTTGEERRILEDYVNQHPAVQEHLALEVAKRMGLADVLMQEQKAEKARTQTPQRNPPVPGVPELLGPDGRPMRRG